MACFDDDCDGKTLALPRGNFGKNKNCMANEGKQTLSKNLTDMKVTMTVGACLISLHNVVYEKAVGRENGY